MKAIKSILLPVLLIICFYDFATGSERDNKQATPQIIPHEYSEKKIDKQNINTSVFKKQLFSIKKRIFKKVKESDDIYLILGLFFGLALGIALLVLFNAMSLWGIYLIGGLFALILSAVFVGRILNEGEENTGKDIMINALAVIFFILRILLFLLSIGLLWN